MSEVEPAAAVVWWRTSLAVTEIPRRHVIGWCDAAGAPTGKIDIVSPHLRLERRTIETALAQDLAGRYATPPRLGTTDELAEILSIEARLRAAGHHVLTRNLTDVYGPRTVGGVVATLLGKGQSAEHTLKPGRHAWLQLVRGQGTLNGVSLAAGDGAAISEEEKLVFTATEPVEALLFDLP